MGGRKGRIWWSVRWIVRIEFYSRKTASHHCVMYTEIEKLKYKNWAHWSMPAWRGLNWIFMLQAPGPAGQHALGTVRDAGICPVRSTESWLSLWLNFSLCLWTLNGVVVPFVTRDFSFYLFASQFIAMCTEGIQWLLCLLRSDWLEGIFVSN